MADMPAAEPLPVEELARSIVATCRSPGACDVASIYRNDASVTVRLADEKILLRPSHPRLALRIAYLKSRVASITQARRANAMLDAVEMTPGDAPLWMLSALRPIAEWVTWANVGQQLSKYTRWAESAHSSKRIVPDRISVNKEIESRAMTLTAGLHGGVLTGSVVLSLNPLCFFTGRPAPRIVVENTTLPEHLISSIDMRVLSRNASVHLGDLVSHPFLSVYNPPVTSVMNRDDAVEIGLACEFMTLAPVPGQAMQVVPSDADPARPWDLTPAERIRLREL